jgi:hypothetical protein
MCSKLWRWNASSTHYGHVYEITDVLWLEGNSITGSLESFCAAFIGDGEYDDHVTDCLEDTVNCSCCTKCCDEDDRCIEMQT